jgi:hypothetical protein
MDVPAALLALFPASKRRLLDVTRRSIDDAMLKEIAAADYGCDLEVHLAALRPIRDRGAVPDDLGWHPGEVLSLTHFCDPERPNPPPFEPGPTGRRGHQIRAFACAVLLYNGEDSAMDSALARCLVSARVLDEEVNEAAGSYLTWEIPQLGVGGAGQRQLRGCDPDSGTREGVPQ